MGLGAGTNNYAELMSLKLLLLFAKEKNVNSIQVFGDSQMVVKWVWNLHQCHNIIFLPILEEVQRLVASFDSFDIHHVFQGKEYDGRSIIKGRASSGSRSMDDI
jgi:ribonuclease HI